MATQLLNGYERFKAQGEALKAKKGAVTNPLSTPVILPVFSIEEKVIEKKEGKNLLNKYHINKLRVVDNRQYCDASGELVLPESITSLVNNKAYLPRHRKLARDYGVNYLLKLTELARTKNLPNRWYVKVTSTANWKQTEEMLIELFKKIDRVKERISSIRVSDQWLNYFVGAFSKLSEKDIADCIELATARGVKKPPNMLAKTVKIKLSQAKPA